MRCDQSIGSSEDTTKLQNELETMPGAHSLTQRIAKAMRCDQSIGSSEDTTKLQNELETMPGAHSLTQRIAKAMRCDQSIGSSEDTTKLQNELETMPGAHSMTQRIAKIPDALQRKPSNMYRPPEVFKRTLATLKVNNKNIIDDLTELARIHHSNAETIVDLILNSTPTDKIVQLYLIDSIIKNVGGPYLHLFGQALVGTFTAMFKIADVKMRKKMHLLRCTWNDVFSSKTLLLLDIDTNKIDINWPVNKTQTCEKDEPVLDDMKENQPTIQRKSTRIRKLTQKAAEALSISNSQSCPKLSYSGTVLRKSADQPNGNLEPVREEQPNDKQTTVANRKRKVGGGTAGKENTFEVTADEQPNGNLEPVREEQPNDKHTTVANRKRKVGGGTAGKENTFEVTADEQPNGNLEPVREEQTNGMSRDDPDAIMNDNNTSNTSSLLIFTEEAVPISLPKPKKRRRTEKNWIFIDEYDTYEAAHNDIKSEKVWSIYSYNQSTTTFRCNNVKKASEQCKSGLKIVLHATANSVSLFASRNAHDCDHLEKSTAKLDPDVRSYIETLYKKGLKCRAIEDQFITDRRPLPAKYVLRNELARLRRNDNGPSNISVAELHAILSKHTEIPDDHHTAYVLSHQIDDKDEISFNFVVSCKKLLQLSVESKVCNADTTYKLIWQGFPVGITGHTDYNNKFHPTSVSISTTENENDFAFTFGAIKDGTKTALDRDWKPPVLMADAALAIRNGFEKVFGADFITLMCWYHAKVAMMEHVANLIPQHKQEKILQDINILQQAQNPEMFKKASGLFVEKYKSHTDFVKYFTSQWLQLHPNWFAGACVDHQIKAPDTNNGLEVFNRTVKDEKTMRVRLPLPQFFNLLLVWVESWARRYDAGTRVYHHKAEVDLPLQTLSYQWVKMKKEVRKHRTAGFYMVPASPDSTLKNWHKTLRYDTFDEYQQNVFRGWSTQISEGPDFLTKSNCNCPSFLAHYMCKHVIGIAICLKIFEPRFEAMQIPVGEKRKRGRPKMASKALLKQ